MCDTRTFTLRIAIGRSTLVSKIVEVPNDGVLESGTFIEDASDETMALLFLWECTWNGCHSGVPSDGSSAATGTSG